MFSFTFLFEVDCLVTCKIGTGNIFFCLSYIWSNFFNMCIYFWSTWFLYVTAYLQCVYIHTRVCHMHFWRLVTSSNMNLSTFYSIFEYLYTIVWTKHCYCYCTGVSNYSVTVVQYVNAGSFYRWYPRRLSVNSASLIMLTSSSTLHNCQLLCLPYRRFIWKLTA